jgi:aryl-alcohol dehydrogenase-like predicted oxidoreductase
MGKAMQTYNIPRRKLVIMTKCYRVACDQENFDAGSRVAMHEEVADRSKDYVNQWGMYTNATA